MTRINRRPVLAVSVLAISLLCSCSSYVPDQGPNQKMSVEEARNIVVQLVRDPVQIFDKQQNTRDVISKVYIRRASITVIGQSGNKYNISLNNLEPSVSRNGGNTWATWIEHSDIFLNSRLSLYTRPNETLGRDEKTAVGLVDALFILKSASLKLLSADEKEARFQEAARNYQRSTTKPQLPEGARQFKIQAEGAVRDKDFGAAADFYDQALEVAPWWPEGHFNRALVLSEVDEYPAAIIEMKRYLVLVPAASNARAAQDQIYNWNRKAAAN